MTQPFVNPFTEYTPRRESLDLPTAFVVTMRPDAGEVMIGSWPTLALAAEQMWDALTDPSRHMPTGNVLAMRAMLAERAEAFSVIYADAGSASGSVAVSIYQCRGPKVERLIQKECRAEFRSFSRMKSNEQELYPDPAR
jgi:hypothetical protein